jgi:hypothetical protein
MRPRTMLKTKAIVKKALIPDEVGPLQRTIISARKIQALPTQIINGNIVEFPFTNLSNSFLNSLGNVSCSLGPAYHQNMMKTTIETERKSAIVKNTWIS